MLSSISKQQIVIFDIFVAYKMHKKNIYHTDTFNIAKQQGNV